MPNIGSGGGDAWVRTSTGYGVRQEGSSSPKDIGNTVAVRDANTARNVAAGFTESVVVAGQTLYVSAESLRHIREAEELGYRTQAGTDFRQERGGFLWSQQRTVANAPSGTQLHREK